MHTQQIALRHQPRMRHSHSQPPAGGVLVAGMASWAGCMRLPAAGGYVNFTDPGNCMGTSQGVWPPADQGPTKNASGAITTTPWNLGGLTGYGLTLGWLDVRGRKWGWGDKRACIQFVCTAAALAAVCASTQRKVADHTPGNPPPLTRPALHPKSCMSRQRPSQQTRKCTCGTARAV